MSIDVFFGISQLLANLQQQIELTGKLTDKLQFNTNFTELTYYLQE